MATSQEHRDPPTNSYFQYFKIKRLLFSSPMSTITLKLLIDSEKKRVVFAESEKEFVDILFSFLTLPMGTIIRLLKKQSSVGCIDNIYKSVENMDTKYLNTKACKTMLLQPRSSAELLCENLFIRVDDLEPRRLYRCRKLQCLTKKAKDYSSVAGVNCSCGEAMNQKFEWKKEKKEVGEAFLKGEATYMISDDLHVLPASVSNAMSFFHKSGVTDASKLEKRMVEVNRDMILRLLEAMLLSKTALTHVFLEKPCSCIEKETKTTAAFPVVKLEDEAEFQDNAIILKLALDKHTKTVLYGEADHAMADILFSFLTFPLGLIVKRFNGNSYLGCVDKLYSSVYILASNGDCFVSDAYKLMLLSPCVYLHHESSHQILKVESKVLSRNSRASVCKTCWKNRSKNCDHNSTEVVIHELNPKMPSLYAENGGGYAKESLKFMVTNDMVITPLSLVSGIDVVKELNVSVSSLTFQNVAIGEFEVVNLLKACLTSSCALNSVFSSVIKPRKLPWKSMEGL